MNKLPKIFNICSEEKFIKKLINVIVNIFLPNVKKEDVTILLPTIATCKDVNEELKKHGIRNVRTLAVNEINSESYGLNKIAAISKLSEIILEKKIALDLSAALPLAEYFADLIQKLELYEIDCEKVKEVIEQDSAFHQQQLFDVLKQILSEWKSRGCYTKVSDLNKARYSLKCNNLIIAGITHNIPSIIHLMKQAQYVVFQGVDLSLSLDEWKNIEETHPQHIYKQILTSLKTNIEEIVNLSTDIQHSSFISKALRPAKSCNKWYERQTEVSNIKYLLCADLHQEARSIVNLLRNYNDSALVVTQDDSLMVKIIAYLEMAGLSAHVIRDFPLKNSKAGILLRLILNLINDNFSTLSSLAFLKHNLVNISTECGEEIELMIRDRNFYGNSIFDIVIEDQKFNDIKDSCYKLNEAFSAKYSTLIELFKVTILFIEQVTIDIWEGEEGKALKEFLDQIASNISDFKQVRVSAFFEIFNFFLDSAYYRPQAQKGNITIAKPIDARFLDADLVILAGLNEGMWPSKPAIDSCLTKQAIKRIGLPGAELQIGVEALDFENFANKREVILSRSEKIEGSVSYPSRWLLRILTLGKNIQLIEPWAYTFEGNNKSKTPDLAIPPINHRPKQLSVTQIDKLLFNPYHLYVDTILNLKPLLPINKELSSLDFGIFVHKALEIYHHNHQEPNLSKLLEAANKAMQMLNLSKTALETIYWQRFLRIANWFIANESRNSKIFLEVYGKIEIDKDFTLIARADRIEKYSNGSIIIIDYKTGNLPSPSSIMAGKNLQLLLEGLIAEKGGYNYQRKPDKINSLYYIQLSGGEEPVSILEVSPGLIEKAEQLLGEIVEFYQNPDSPFFYTKKKKLGYCEYEHLARKFDS